MVSLLSLSMFIFAWCWNKDKIQVGDIISITYTATFSNGEIFDNTTEKNPLLFTVGEKQTIQWLDEAVVGMKIGKQKTITIPADKWYGSLYSTNLIQKIGKLIFDTLEIPTETGTSQKLDNIEWVITWIEIDDDGNELVLFDINPRQTWDTLTYKITVIAKQE